MAPTLDYTDKYARQIEGIYSQTKDVERFFVVAGNPTVSQGIFRRPHRLERPTARRSADVVKELFPEVHGHPRRAGLPGHAAVAGAKVPGSAGSNFVIVTSAAYENCNGSNRGLARWPKSGADQRRHRSQTQQAGTVGGGQSGIKAADLGSGGNLGWTWKRCGWRLVTRFKRDGEHMT